MKGYVIGFAFYAGLFYMIANAAYALSNPQGWVRARWTARRGIDPDTWSNGDIRAFGVFFTAAAVGWGWVTIKLTLRLLQGAGY